MQRTQHHLVSIRQLLDQGVVYATDLSLPRQEDQYAAGFLLQRLQNRLHDARLDAFANLKRSPPALRDGKHAPFAAHHRRLIQQAGQPSAFERGGHEQQLERLLAQQYAGVERQRQGQVGIEAALVEFIEDHQTHAFERRVVLQAAREDALGDNLDAGVRPDLAVQPDAIANGLANLFAQLAGQPFGRRSGSETPRLEHQHLLSGEPWLMQQRQRHSGGLAGAGRRFEHGFVTHQQGLAQRRQDFIDRQGFHTHSCGWA